MESKADLCTIHGFNWIHMLQLHSYINSLTIK